MKLYTVLCLVSSLAFGCLHFDIKYKYKIQEGTKAAFLFHDGTQAHLVVKTDLSTKARLPASRAWVMPFPALPTRYEETEPGGFEELGRITHPKKAVWGGTMARDGHSALSPKKIKVHDAHVVGNYKIQPIEILDPSGGQDFNAWLKANHFNSMPDDLQKPYLKKGAVFLAIKVALKGKLANLKPLHIVYPADHLSFPLKFTHDTRTFDLDLFVFTQKVSNEDPKLPGLKQTAQGSYVPAMLAEQFPLLYGLLGERDGFITLYEGRKLNTKGNFLRELPADPTITLK